MLELAKINNSISTIIDELLQKGRIDDEYKRILAQGEFSVDSPSATNQIS